MIAGFLFPEKIDHFNRMTPMSYILLLQGDATAFPGRDKTQERECTERCEKPVKTRVHISQLQYFHRPRIYQPHQLRAYGRVGFV